VRYPLSYRQVEDILHERGIDICHETVRYWVERFGLKFAQEIRICRFDDENVRCRSLKALRRSKVYKLSRADIQPLQS